MTAHLRRPDEHGRLAFHPECPLCSSERLSGALPRDAVMGLKTQAVLAAGVIALSTASPAVVLAQEPEQQQEGAASPDPVAVEDSSNEPGFDPGGSTIVAPVLVAPAAAPPVENLVASEPEPKTDETAPTADLGDGSGSPQAPVTPPVTPSPASELPASPAPPLPPQTPAPPTSAATETPLPPAEGEPGGVRKRERPIQTEPLTTPPPPPLPSEPPAANPKPSPADDRANAPSPAPQPAAAPAPQLEPAAAPAPQPEPAAAPAPQPEPAAAPAPQPEPAAAPSAPASRNRAARRGAARHVVRPGESLWSIAGDVLGDDASTARIAREVNRLWELNRSRIATGNPDLIAVGTKLVLR